MSTVFPVAAGFPEHSGVMFPEIWSAKMLVKYYDSTVLSEIANTDYEGEIKEQGDTVHIRTTPTISIKDHVMGQKLEYETPKPDLVDLVIDKGKSWAFISDDIQRSQSDYAYVENWTQDAAEQMKISIDTDVLGTIYADAHAQNKGTAAGRKSASFNLGATGAAISLDKTNILDYIVDCGTVLDEQNAPEMGRWFLMPPWACGLIKKSDLKDASLSGDGKSTLRTGRIGEIDRFTIYMSNLLAVTSDSGSNVTNMMFGHKQATTFAAQLIKSEGPMRDKDFFGDFYRGLQVFGYKVIKKEALGHFYAKKG